MNPTSTHTLSTVDEMRDTLRRISHLKGRQPDTQSLQEVRSRGARITWFYPTRQVPAAAALQRGRRHIERLVPLASLADLMAARHVLH